jgi:ribosome biogenesis GTPase A
MSSNEAIYIDEIIDKALALCENLPPRFQPYREAIEECRYRLGHGALRLAVMGLFKRGKSSFINTLLGIDILPTSVIPVTSIPTTIAYGKSLRCVVKFFNKKPDLIVRESAEGISACLKEHVAEENNPLNRLCVSEAVVECPNPLLENGTILIDTPGFGSTYVHNTKTTLDLLTQCDAVLFLLSADPPFTQTEVEFLKEVRKAVPRIFFILNKIDLLTIDELKKIDGFLKGILTNNLGFPADAQVFHVSARIGQSLKNLPDNNPAWRISGMSAIKSGIIDFMLREKYFTLSQAIGDKFKGALSDIQSQLEADYLELTGPAVEARKEHEWIIHHSGSIQKKIDKERGLIDVEIKAFNDFVDKTIDAKKGELQQKSTDALRTVLGSVLLRKSNLAHTVHAAFEQHAAALFDNLFLQVVNTVNKPLKKAVLLHVNEFIKLLDEIKKAAPSASAPLQELEAMADDVEIRTDTRWRLEGVALAFQHIKLPFCGFFASDATKRQRYQDCFAMAITEIINRNIIRLSMYIKELINSAYKEFKKDLDSRFEGLMAAMGQVMEEKKKTIDNFESAVKAQAEDLQKRKAAFREVAKTMG